MAITTINDFIREFTRIKNLGWIKTHRAGPTGIGKTLEDLLGIPENNTIGPDFGNYELKSARINSQSMLTLFTKSPAPRGVNGFLLQRFGYPSDNYDNDRNVLHATLSTNYFSPVSNTGNSLRINCSNDRISIESNFGIENAYWTRNVLENAFNRKYRHTLIFVKADSRYSGRDEELNFLEAFELSGFDFFKMMELLEQGRIYVDIRIGQYPDGRAHDHGTGFRLRIIDLPLLFSTRNRIA